MTTLDPWIYNDNIRPIYLYGHHYTRGFIMTILDSWIYNDNIRLMDLY